ncbi:hypothetical protein EHV15_07655 [Paenibacillus oralis]|uniref:Uncharacterized protein n=1 Tax=Paenibacillus oralis TaxID=2490856 RepID=A0A3P3TXH3_9BACL|nr:hypothetical protein EHV15_07655 [Paenibacillus oralis]
MYFSLYKIKSGFALISGDNIKKKRARLPYEVVKQAKCMILRWPGWNLSAHFETGPNVVADVNYVASTVKDCPPEIKDCAER